MEVTEVSSSQDERDSVVFKVLGVPTLEEYIQPGYSALKEAVVSSNSLPEGLERASYLKHEEFSEIMKQERTQILDSMQMILSYVGKGLKISDLGDEEKSEVVVDTNDWLLDRSSYNMDVLEGIRQAETLSSIGRHKAVSGSWNRPNVALRSTPTSSPSSALFSPSLTASKSTNKPQLSFRDKIDNSNSPWVPRIKEKPNAIKPLAILVENTDDGDECYSHPYEYELDRWAPPNHRLTRIHMTKPNSLEQTQFLFVENSSDLRKMLQHLSQEVELAVDLEHHSYRSFMGFTCLMQISTRDKDYVIDAITLRDELHVLNEVFTNPKVLKVFHGADNDVEWLQRDLSLYLVNMFDTHQAAKLLQFPRLNLAHLLAHYCNIDANKHFQLFDWRTRPLPHDAIKYAREDTHYLLYIYSMMNNDLIRKADGNTNLLESVYTRSTQVCKKRYIKPMLDEGSHMLLYRKGKKMFDNRQLYALKELFKWRDRIARELDESIGYVLPNHMMIQIAENLPREMQGVLACCNPIPPVLRQSVHEIHNILLTARDQPLVKTVRESTGVTEARRDKQFLRHRWEQAEDAVRDDLPTLLDSPGLPTTTAATARPPQSSSLLAATCSFLFDYDENEYENSKRIMKRMTEIENKKYLTPYQRYKLVLPYVNELEKEQKDKEAKEYEEQKRKQKAYEMERNEVVLKQKVIKFEKKMDSSSPVPLSNQVAGHKRKRGVNVAETAGDVAEITTARLKQEPEVDRTEIRNGNKHKLVSKTEDSETPVKKEPKGVTRIGRAATYSQRIQGDSSVKKEEKEDYEGKKSTSDQVQGGMVTSPKVEVRRETCGDEEEEDTSGLRFRNDSFDLNVADGWSQLKKQQGRTSLPTRHQDTEFVPYNYNKVDFDRFQSGAEKFVRLPNDWTKNKVKRKQQFNGKNLPNKHKRNQRPF